MKSSSIAVLAVLSLQLVVLPSLAVDEAPPLREWIDGPVRYIARKDEARQFKALDNDGDRALFIEKFWNRRDPTPETLVNEYRTLFWERVQQANSTFHGSTRPGWMTDRGKIYILYGPPTEKKEFVDYESSDGIPGGGRGLIRWIYEGRPGNRVDMDAITVVAFVRDYTGEYRLSYDPKLSSVFFQADLGRSSFGSWSESLISPSRSQLAVMLDLGKLQEVPPQEQVLLERVETIESYRTVPLAADMKRYRHPDQPGFVAVVTLDLSVFSVRSDPALIARFSPRDVTSPPRLIGEGSFRIERHDQGRIAQGRLVLPPGTYDVMLLAADPFDIGTGIYRGVMVIPEDPEVLEISDITLASALEPLPYASLASYDEPFVIGPYRVVPRTGSSLAPGDPVELFFEIYGGTRPFRVTTQLQGMDYDGSWVDLGGAQRTESVQVAQAWGLTTSSGWPAGEYRVRIRVEDAAGSAVDSSVSFSLAEDTPQPDETESPAE